MFPVTLYIVSSPSLNLSLKFKQLYVVLNIHSFGPSRPVGGGNGADIQGCNHCQEQQTFLGESCSGLHSLQWKYSQLYQQSTAQGQTTADV